MGGLPLIVAGAIKNGFSLVLCPVSAQVGLHQPCLIDYTYCKLCFEKIVRRKV